MWIYRQSDGALFHDSSRVGTGYSGNGRGLNNADMENMPGVGPIPRGKWNIDRWDAHHGDKGPVVAVLAPVGQDAHGRSEFLVHGDNDLGNHSASHGCIILNRDLREKMQSSGDHALEVIR